MGVWRHISGYEYVVSESIWAEFMPVNKEQTLTRFLALHGWNR